MLHEGLILGKYRLATRLATTQMSEVWSALDTSQNRSLALKVVRRCEDNDTLVKAAEFGAELQKRISDPRVVCVHEYGTIGEFLCIDMDYVPGSDIQKLLKNRYPIRPDAAVKVALEVCRTLVALDSFKATIGERSIQSAVHGDLKPSNIRIVGDISGDFSVRILDFGTAKGLSMASPGGTRTPAFTPEYASPELLRTREMNQLSDRWALGVTLYEMVMGHLPFGNGESADKVETAILDATTPPPLDGAHPALQHILGRLLHPEISKRYRTAKELLEDLEKYPEVPETKGYQGTTQRAVDGNGARYRGETVRATSGGAPPSEPARAPARQRPRVSNERAFGIAGGLFLIVLFGALIWWGSAQRKAWTGARQLEADLKVGAVEPEAALGQYEQMTANHFTILPGGSQIPQLIATAFVNRGDGILFRFEHEAVKIAEFMEARTLFQKAQRLLPDNGELGGRIILCDAHIDRMRLGQTEDAIKTEEIARKYDEAARLLPKSADPLLGKAMLYLYVARNPERGEESLTQAIPRKYVFTTSVRWVHLLAQTYTQRARILEREASQLVEVLPDQALQRLNTAIAYVDKAIYWYSQFPTQGSAINEIKACRRLIERFNGTRASMQATGE